MCFVRWTRSALTSSSMCTGTRASHTISSRAPRAARTGARGWRHCRGSSRGPTSAPTPTCSASTPTSPTPPRAPTWPSAATRLLRDSTASPLLLRCPSRTVRRTQIRSRGGRPQGRSSLEGACSMLWPTRCRICVPRSRSGRALRRRICTSAPSRARRRASLGEAVGLIQSSRGGLFVVAYSIIRRRASLGDVWGLIQTSCIHLSSECMDPFVGHRTAAGRC
mmetsp:Transcript_1202/g.2845  ORF Transcript_1202/g.2845 Transcript_1202/m.2845 type:complete len:222 (-) Transcript_1202:59-724(-)